MDFIRRTDSSLALQEKVAKEKQELLENVKREAKRLMEEAVTRRFVHADSSSVTLLCAAVDACLSHRMKKRLLSSNSTESLISKFSKYDEDAGEIAKQCSDAQENASRVSMSDNQNKKTVLKINGFNVSVHHWKHLWIRLALLERVLAKIIGKILDHNEEFYENDAFIADQVYGPSLVWLLDGPCSLDYSKMKTPETSWSDPPADELVMRHRIYGGTSTSSASQLNKPQLFYSPISETISSAPHLAREHVDSLHQNAHSSLVFGKNNVQIDMPELGRPVAGYLSIHKCPESLLLKWTPNPMMSGESGTEKSQYWNRVLTIDMSDIVFLHCHQSGQTGTVVLIGQDGLQLPPLSFTSGSLLPFLTCLEQGLAPNGRFDPPLSLVQLTNVAQVKRNILSEKIAKMSEEKDKSLSQDFVFRIINGVRTGTVDKKQLQKLLSNATPSKILPIWKQKEEKRKNLLPKLHSVKLQRSGGTPARVSVQLAYDKMKYQILSRAFHGWIAHCRYLKTVRTHLASLILPVLPNQKLPADVENGVTEKVFDRLCAKGRIDDMMLLMQYVYYGGVDPSQRYKCRKIKMGCTASHVESSIPVEGKEGKMMFPLSMYQKSLIQETWTEVEKELITFGCGIFYRLFKLKPELISVFPEFGYLENIEDIKKMSKLSGHPRKIINAIREAIKSLDDAENFVTKLEALGQRHVENSLRPDYLHALGHAFNSQIKDMLGDDCTKDVAKAWSDFYNFICRLMKSGLAKKKGETNEVGWF